MGARRKVCDEGSAGESRGSEPSVESNDDSATAEARLRREIYMGHVAAVAGQENGRSSGAGHWRRTDRAALGDSACRNRGHRVHQGDGPQCEDVLAENDVAARSQIRVEDSEVEQR